MRSKILIIAFFSIINPILITAPVYAGEEGEAAIVIQKAYRSYRDKKQKLTKIEPQNSSKDDVLETKTTCVMEALAEGSASKDLGRSDDLDKESKIAFSQSIKSNEIESILDNVVVDFLLNVSSEKFKLLSSMDKLKKTEWVSELVNSALSNTPGFQLTRAEIERQKERIASNILPLFLTDDGIESLVGRKVSKFEDRLSSYCTHIGLLESPLGLNKAELGIIDGITRYLLETRLEYKSPLERRVTLFDGGAMPNLKVALDLQAFEVLTKRYEEQGMIQEQVWLLRRIGQFKESMVLEGKLEIALRSGEITTVVELGKGGASNPLLVTLADGTQGVFKPYDKRGYKEIASYNFDKLIGLDVVPMAIEREVGGKLGSLQYYIRDSRDGQDYSQHHLWITGGFTGVYVPERIKKLRFLDLVLLNYDINEKGFLIRKNGQQVAIDYNCAFESPGNSVRQVESMRDKVGDYYPGDLSYKRLNALREVDLANITKIAQADEKISQEIFRRIQLFIQLTEQKSR